MLDKIINVLSKYSEYDKSKITRDTTFVMDMGLNSIDVMKIVLELEDEFDIEFPEEDLLNITTIGELEDEIKELMD
jgi:acyl carrier protein